MSIKFNLTGHKKLWNWLAEHPRNSKGDYFRIANELIPEHDCYACDYSERCVNQMDCDAFCESCPFMIENSIFCLNGLYDEWEDAKEDENAARERVKELALKIANLPVREGVECE